MQDIHVNEVEPVAVAATMYQSGDEEFWKAHVLTAQNFSGSDELYCKRNRLSLSAFNEHKRKLGLTKRYQRKQVSTAPSKKEPKAFVKLECKAEPAKPSLVNPSPQARVRTSASGLPDPKWMAEFVTELLALR